MLIAMNNPIGSPKKSSKIIKDVENTANNSKIIRVCFFFFSFIKKRIIPVIIIIDVNK
jgi:hypothetical protein